MKKRKIIPLTVEPIVDPESWKKKETKTKAKRVIPLTVEETEQPQPWRSKNVKT